MTILVTGGTGQTGAILSKLLHDANIPLLVASRSGNAPEHLQGVKFNWLDPTTFENPFNQGVTITKAYIIGPNGVYDALEYVKPFLELAVSKGVKRFVALTSTLSNPGDRPQGIIHQVLLDLSVDYTILRPTWFMENFSTIFYHSIKEHDEIITASGNGRVPFISAQDIARVAFDALTAEKGRNTDIYILGPEYLSYDEAAEFLSSTLGRKITHRKISEDDKAKILGNFLSPEYAAYIAKIESLIASGSEEVLRNLELGERKVVGKVTLLEYFQTNKDLWQK